MTANMQDNKNPELPRYIIGEEGGGTKFLTNQQLNAPLTTQ